MESSIDQVYGSYPPKKIGKGERDPEGGIGGGRDPREWRCGLQKVLSG